MGAQREEEEARRLIKESGATLKRTTGGHELWLLPNGLTFPLRAKGRQPPSTRQWLNILSKLKKALSGQEYRMCRQSTVASFGDATESEVEAAATALEDEEEDDVFEQEWNKPKVKRRKTVIEEETVKVKLSLWHITEAMKRMFGIEVPAKHDDLSVTVNDAGDVVVSWTARKETIEEDKDGDPDVAPK